MLSSSSTSLSLRGRPSGLSFSAAGVVAASAGVSQASAAAAAGVAVQGSAAEVSAPVPAQSVVGSVAFQSFAPDSTAASTVAACSVLNSVLPSSPPQP